MAQVLHLDDRRGRGNLWDQFGRQGHKLFYQQASGFSRRA
jgi:hypothetical protein